MYLIENNKYMITSGSMYTVHRFFSNKPTIICIFESNCTRWNGFHKEDNENKNYIFYDADLHHLDSIKHDIKKWYS